MKSQKAAKSAEDELEEGSSSNTDCDQDTDVSFMNDADEEIDATEIEQEDSVEYMKRSTAEAEERMKAAQIPCWQVPTRRRAEAPEDILA